MTKLKSPPRRLGGEDVKFALSSNLANQNRAFYTQHPLNLVYIDSWGCRILNWSTWAGGRRRSEDVNLIDQICLTRPYKEIR